MLSQKTCDWGEEEPPKDDFWLSCALTQVCAYTYTHVNTHTYTEIMVAYFWCLFVKHFLLNLLDMPEKIKQVIQDKK